MKRFLAIVAFAALLSSLLHAQDKTLRIDYIFSGTAKSADISLDCLSSIDGWAGRTVNLDKVPVKGNGQISMTDLSTGNVIYRQSFSSLFQGWGLLSPPVWETLTLTLASILLFLLFWHKLYAYMI